MRNYLINRSKDTNFDDPFHIWLQIIDCRITYDNDRLWLVFTSRSNVQNGLLVVNLDLIVTFEKRMSFIELKRSIMQTKATTGSLQNI